MDITELLLDKFVNKPRPAWIEEGHLMMLRDPNRPGGGQAWHACPLSRCGDFKSVDDVRIELAAHECASVGIF